MTQEERKAVVVNAIKTLDVIEAELSAAGYQENCSIMERLKDTRGLLSFSLQFGCKP